MQPTTIEVTSLTKRFGRVLAVDDLTFTVNPGRITGFLGPNGAGKTTTLRCIVGLVKTTGGSATLGGRRYAELHRPTTVIGAALESSGFHPGRSGRDHLRIRATAIGAPAERADELLAFVGLGSDGRRKAGQYSLGMRQRLALAMALVGDPAVLVLDEPANGLDPAGIAWLRQFLRHLASEGRTILISSHLLAEVRQTADEVVIIDSGRLVKAGTIASLVEGEALVRATGPDLAPLARAINDAGRQAVPAPDNTLSIAGLSAAEVGHLAWQHQVELHHLSEDEPELERIFLSLTSEPATTSWAPPTEPPLHAPEPGAGS